ncbi:MAG: toxin-antitoxin system YwqK family antitoxin [Chlamydiae bacterium]|nr:toxin-antitoxin system YwqK family antitoxin [Chlamydiota bacterium]
MKKISLFLGLPFLLNAGIKEAASELKVRIPEWRSEVVRSYDGEANPAEVLFFEEEDGKEKPVKKILLYPTGRFKEETDLTYIDGKIAPHGVSIVFSESGQVESTAFYSMGQEDGVKEYYYPTGQIKESITFKKGKRSGPYSSFYETGAVAEERNYVDGLLEGEVRVFYPSGKLYKVIFHKANLLEGEYQEFYESGAIKCRAFYEKGELSSKDQQPSVTKYDELRTVIEVQEHKNGKPIGLHCSYYPNGKEKEHIEYKDGQFHGTNRAFSSEGVLIAEGAFDKGMPVGKHWKKHANGKLAYVAIYDKKGKLKEPIVEFNENGQKIAQYYVQNKELHGEYQEWYPSGKIAKQYVYSNGKWSQEQIEYHENGKKKGHFFCKNGEYDGKFEQWHEDGRYAKKAFFISGKPQGQLIEWHENGKLKLQTAFSDGKLDGSYEEWSKEGVLIHKGAYLAGEKHGNFQVFDEEGQMLFDANYLFGQVDGKYVKNLTNDQPLEIVEFKNGKKHGSFLEYWPNGKLRVKGFYQNDLAEGLTQGWFEDGKIAFTRFYKGGVLVGEQKDYYPSHLIFEKDREQLSKITCYNSEGKLHGEQKTFFVNGTVQTLINYKMGQLHGIKARWDDKGRLFEEASYENGKLEGRFFELDPEGREIVCFYEKNKKHGPYSVFYPENPRFGKVKAIQAEYVNGKIEGELSEYTESGSKISMICYKNGKKDGIAQIFDQKGLVVTTVSFENDQKHGDVIHYYPNGKIYKSIRFIKDQQEGEEKTFFQNGALSNIACYKEGKLDGVTKSWNEQGVLVFEGEYKQGTRHGIFNKYFDSGKPRVLQRFENDQLVGAKQTFSE